MAMTRHIGHHIRAPTGEGNPLHPSNSAMKIYWSGFCNIKCKNKIATRHKADIGRIRCRPFLMP